MAPRWLCECERTVADDLPACWSCGRPRPTTTDGVVARLTAEVEAMREERDMWRGECASISAELDLPPGIRPAEGELRRMLEHSRALLAQVTTLTAEAEAMREALRGADEVKLHLTADRDEALANATVERTTANEWLAQLHDAKRERDEARGLLREALPLMHGDYDDEIEMRARIAAYLEGR